MTQSSQRVSRCLNESPGEAVNEAVIYEGRELVKGHRVLREDRGRPDATPKRYGKTESSSTDVPCERLYFRLENSSFVLTSAHTRFDAMKERASAPVVKG